MEEFGINPKIGFGTRRASSPHEGASTGYSGTAGSGRVRNYKEDFHMAGSATKVDTNQLRNVSKQLSEIDGQYNTAISQLKTLGDELDALWDGEASDKFKTQLTNEMEPTFKAMSTILKAYVTGLTEVAGIYEKAEAEASSVVATNSKG